MRKKLNQVEQEYIKNNFQYKSILAMERESGISKYYIKEYMKSENLKVEKIPRTIRKDGYSVKEEQFIKENYLRLSYREIGQILGRKESAISSKISKMGLVKSRKWTQKEIEILKQVYPIYPNSYIIKSYLPHRDKNCMVDKAMELGLKKERKFHYTKEQLKDFLIDFAKELGRTPLTTDIHNNGEIPSVSTYTRYFGSYEQACVECGLEMKQCLFGNYITKNIAKDNKTICLSNSELFITNFLIDNNIRFEKEKTYSDIFNRDYGLKRSDWYLTDYDVIVEYFGLHDKDFYKEKMEQKIKICKQNNKKLIAITDRCLTDNKLQNIFKKFI